MLVLLVTKLVSQQDTACSQSVEPFTHPPFEMVLLFEHATREGCLTAPASYDPAMTLSGVLVSGSMAECMILLALVESVPVGVMGWLCTLSLAIHRATFVAGSCVAGNNVVND